uniref:UDP-N-acetylmuramoyl-L-alanyl-D-glutamatesynthetase n=1 Tax=Paulinella longichromatophora TaxID=1708747 RepID=A0A2H4ZQM2_9EUKA|nr:UDP-N-acetylmuramoyl-L-alanyl-D- glutamatesynthetase [Paulinella longichromatophora]
MTFIVVLGLGKSGIAAARLLVNQNKQVVILEERTGTHLKKIAIFLLKEGIEVRLGVPLKYSSFKEFYPLMRIITSPGIPWNHPVLNYFRSKGICISGDTTLAWEILGEIPWIAITGTNGKTTVTRLIHHILSYAGLDAPLCGNIGPSVNELILSRNNMNRYRPDWLVVELSSYQIESAPALQPWLAVWTTLTPDHLERHGTLANYRLIKGSLLERSNYQILNGDDPDLRTSNNIWTQPTWVTTGSRLSLPNGSIPSLWVEEGQVTTEKGQLFSTDCLSMLGNHNKQNLLMATAVGIQINLAPSLIQKAFCCFPGVPHRLEFVRSYKGVCFYNDSKATNYDAAEVGIKAIKEPMVVIAGGQAKYGSSHAWIKQLKAKTKVVILIGEAQQKFKYLLELDKYKGLIHCCSNLEQAVPTSFFLATQFKCLAVLFSPACASFDQYRDFEARGNDFRQKVNSLNEISQYE